MSALAEDLTKEKSLREYLRTQLDQLKAIEAHSLDRVDELGQALSFQEGQPYFQRALRLFRELEAANLDSLSWQNLQSLAEAAEQANACFSQIQNFSVAVHQQNPAQARDELIEQIRDNYHGWFNEVTPSIAYSMQKGTDFQRLERQARAHSSRIEQISSGLPEQRDMILAEAQRVVAEAPRVVAEAQRALAQVRDVAQEVGVAQHANHFKSEANQHEEDAGKWLIAVVFLAVATAGFSVVNIVSFFNLSHVDLTTAETIQLAVAKVILFSLLFSALVWVGRVYRSHRHNFVVNKHRQNALSSFETFAQAAQDEQTKSAVLLQATNCIFAPQSSGYSDSSAESPSSPSVVEIIRNMAENK